MSFINKSFTKINMSKDKPLFSQEETILSNTEVSNYKEFFEDLNKGKTIKNLVLVWQNQPTIYHLLCFRRHQQ